MKRYITSIIFIFLLAGCVSVSSSPTPSFYMLQPVPMDQISAVSEDVSGFVVAIGPIKIPEYQDRPQMVTQDKNGMLTFAQFDRWGESLDQGMQRIIVDNLTVMFPKAVFGIFPCNHAIPVKYQVIAEVVKLESNINDAISFTVQWALIDVRSSKMLFTKRSEFRQPVNPHNYHGLTKALSIECSNFSRDIAEALVKLEERKIPEKESVSIQK